MNRPPLTPARADRILTAASPRQGLGVLWGCDDIGRAIGRPADYVRKHLSRIPGSPVKKVAGRWCAVEADLIYFIRR